MLHSACALRHATYSVACVSQYYNRRCCMGVQRCNMPSGTEYSRRSRLVLSSDGRHWADRTDLQHPVLAEDLDTLVVAVPARGRVPPSPAESGPAVKVFVRCDARRVDHRYQPGGVPAPSIAACSPQLAACTAWRRVHRAMRNAQHATRHVANEQRAHATRHVTHRTLRVAGCIAHMSVTDAVSTSSSAAISALYAWPAEKTATGTCRCNRKRKRIRLRGGTSTQRGFASAFDFDGQRASSWRLATVAHYTAACRGGHRKALLTWPVRKWSMSKSWQSMSWNIPPEILRYLHPQCCTLCQRCVLYVVCIHPICVL